MKNIVTFGEIMLRLAPIGYQRFLQSPSFEATFGGGEANVAVSLSNFGLKSSFVSKLPDNDIGQSAISELRKYGVETSFISLGGERVGIYYLEKGASQRPSKVIYDRKFSSVSMSKPQDFDFDSIMKNAAWFHFTGITPALGEALPEICENACKKAKEYGVTISCDLNYRKNLWTTENANEIMSKLMEYVDICIANEEDTEKVFGIKPEKSDVSGGLINFSDYEKIARKLSDRFDFKKVCITLRESINANDNNWSAMLFDESGVYFSKKYPIHIVDRVGGGDSFAAGIIYALVNNYSQQETIEFAVAASCLKHTIEGDFNIVSIQEINNLLKGDGTGRVQR
jgi:2-dehydro-3-deoxygluconokinase